jgi:ribonucleotide monophosphatase NagD (HAD superfamily)
MVMIGDQIATDIQGAQAFGIDSVLVGSGITNRDTVTTDDHLLPTYAIPSIMHDHPDRSTVQRSMKKRRTN